MESGTPDVKGTTDGWLNRYLAASGTCEQCQVTPFRAVAMAPQTPRMLQGSAPTVAMDSLDQFAVRTGGDATARLEALYRTGSPDLVHGAGTEMFDAVKMLKSADPQRHPPENGAEYPRSQFGQRLRQIAQLIKSGVGLEVAFADLGDRMENVVILTMSEPGRMARQNGNGGTDHGHAGAMFVIGGSVKGKTVHGRWPGAGRRAVVRGPRPRARHGLSLRLRRGCRQAPRRVKA